MANLTSTTITGTLNTTSTITGPASGASALNASNVSSGTLASDRLPTVPTTKGGTGLTSIGSAGQVLKVTAPGTALEFGDAGGGVSSSTINIYNSSSNLSLSSGLQFAAVKVIGGGGGGGGGSQGNNQPPGNSGGNSSLGTLVTASGGSGLWELIHEETLTSAGTFDDISISSGYDEIEVTVFARGDRNDGADGVLMYLNNDTTAANYKHNYYYLGSADGNSVGDSAWIGTVPAATADANHFGNCKAIIEKPDRSDKYRGWSSENRDYRGGTRYHAIGSVTWLDLAAITEIDVVGENESFVSGSSIVVVGRTW